MISLRAGMYMREGENVSTFVAVEIVYAGLVSNCMIKEQPKDFTYENVTDWVEAMYFDPEGQKVLGEIVNVFMQSRALKQFQEMAEDIKKKMMETIGTDSKLTPSESLDYSQASTTI